MVELGQLGSGANKLYIHKNPESNETILNQAIDTIQTISNNQIETTGLDQPIPPSSLQTFLRFNATIPGKVRLQQSSSLLRLNLELLE
jgi:hypothetical protein